LRVGRSTGFGKVKTLFELPTSLAAIDSGLIAPAD